MNIDPLADSAPPRHAYESDDEDEDGYDPRAIVQPVSKPEPLDVEIAGTVPKGGALFLAAGEAAKAWARGAQLGEQKGAVFVNKVQVGMVFAPPWTKSSVLVSEVTTRLPTRAMHAYAEAVLGAFTPSRLAIMDIYSVHAYISQEPILPQDAPIRYLSVNSKPPAKATAPQLFAPPNLLQSTSASFMALAALSSAESSGTLAASLILLPSPRIPPPAPATLAPSSFAELGSDDSPWSAETMQVASQALLAAAGDNATLTWESKGKSKESKASASRRGDVGDGGMYI